MFFKKIDFLSPKITLYNNGELRHSSIFSGILTLLLYVIVVAVGIVLSLDAIQKINPSAFYFNGYEEDAGFFPLNSSSIFHYIKIINTESNNVDPIDFDSVRIIGLIQTIDIYSTSDKNLLNLTHWIYGNCNDNDIKGIENLINEVNFKNAACIRKYFNKEEQKYYNTSEKGFVWPSVDKGCTHPNRTFYGIVVEQCRNDSLKQNCKNLNEIQKYFFEHSIDFRFVNQYTNVYNFNNPIQKYFYDASSGIFEGSYSTNHLNFNPLKVITHTGIIFDHVKEELSYLFTQNEKITAYWDENDTGIYSAFYFWMQNQMQYYERTYKRLINVLADIGGFANSAFFVVTFLNKLFNNYIRILDTQDLIMDIDKKIEDSYLYGNKNNIKIINQQRSKSVFQYNNIKNLHNDNNIPNNIILGGKIENNINKNIINDNERNNYDQSIGTKNFLITNNFFENNMMLNIINKKGQLNQNNYVIFTPKNSPFNKEYKRIERISFNFFDYLSYLICNKKNKILRYEDFRKTIVSEEQIIQTYIKLYKILNNFNDDNKNNNNNKKKGNIDLTLIMKSVIK